MRIIFNTGEASYIDIEDQDETYKVFDIVDLTRIRIKTLSKPGREDTYTCFLNNSVMGGLLAFRVGNYNNTAEREQFRLLCEMLNSHYKDSEEFCVFVGNYNIGCEIDALLIKKDAIIVIEFKNYGGHIIANENGEWTSDGKIIRGGSRKTVLQQALINHVTVKRELKALGVERKHIKHVPTIVVFHQPIELKNNLSITNKSWLHITDNIHFLDKVDDITCPKTDFDVLGIINIAELLNLKPFYLKEFSNAVYESLEIGIDSGIMPERPFHIRCEQEKYVESLCENSVKLPNWLEQYIYDELGANYCCSNTDMVVLEWDRNKILNYLGTYFPRSFAEGYSMFNKYAKLQKDYIEKKSSLTLFDFGCGTGGELVGLILAIKENFPHINTFRIKALDGNIYALRILESILSKLSVVVGVEIHFSPIPIIIEDFYDMSLVVGTLSDPFDFIISFKALCEFVTKQQFESKNPYTYFLNTFIENLSNGGCFFLADITTYNDVSQEWLPKMLDQGIINQSNLDLIASNPEYNEEFRISHSKKKNDVSKIAWRILRKNDNNNLII